jgi:RND family efflux transporter MFP subunit
MHKKYLAACLFISFVVYFAWATFFAKGAEKTNPNLPIKPVKTVVATTTNFHSIGDFSGFVSGVRQADISPKAGGYVTGLLKIEGDSVKAGETIATLDGSELLAMDQSALMSLDAVQKTLGETKEFYAQKVDEAQAMLKKIKENYSNGSITEKDVKVGEEALDSAKKMRDLQNSGADANVATAQGGELVAHIATKNATIVAPFSGIITKKYATVGSFVAPGTPLYAIASPADLEIDISVPGSIGGNLSRGEEVSVIPNGQTGSVVSGYIFSVSGAVEATMQKAFVRVRFSEAENKKALFLGQYVNVTIPAGKERVAILIPEKAILREYDDTFVFILDEDGKVKKQKIILGEASGELHEVLSGVFAGDRIVTEGQYALRDGDFTTEK